MFKHIIKYTDYNGTEREDTCYFNLSKAEVMEMELSTKAGISESIRMMIETNDNEKIIQTYKNLILKSYGIKSEDGRRFIKSKELSEAFEQSEAYSEFFIEMLSDSNLQIKFINGIVNGVNVPNTSEEEAINKLKELGYDTSLLEKLSNEKKEVVDVTDENKNA